MWYRHWLCVTARVSASARSRLRCPAATDPAAARAVRAGPGRRPGRDAARAAARASARAGQPLAGRRLWPLRLAGQPAHSTRGAARGLAGQPAHSARDAARGLDAARAMALAARARGAARARDAARRAGQPAHSARDAARLSRPLFLDCATARAASGHDRVRGLKRRLLQ